MSLTESVLPRLMRFLGFIQIQSKRGRDQRRE